MFESISAWLIGAESRRAELSFVVSELARRLIAEGVPLLRLRVSVLAMHPEVFGRSALWSPDGGTEVVVNKLNLFLTPAFVGSPIEAVLKGQQRVRARLERGELPYPQLKELRDEGGTDYAVFALELGEGRRTFLSIATDTAGGFSDEQLEALEALLPALTIRLELESTRFSSETLLELYLGQNAARRVLAGDFRRGTGQVIHAAIWLCDLRGFTALADRIPVAEVVPVLDAYFEAMARPVRESSGEILKFIGDSILAVFPTEADVSAACRRAVTSAAASIEAFATVPSAKEHGLRAGVAVNLGEVMYGNIGASDRLDFTVIGSAVNEAARMEAMCKTLDTPVVLSEAVVRHLPAEDVHPLGSHPLRGVSGDRPLFTLARFKS